MPEFSTETTALVALVSSSVAKYVFAAMARKNMRKNMIQVGTVTQLNCYPIKSCRGFSLQSGLCTPLGLKTGNAVDRHWVVVRSNGDFVTQRQLPKMALIQTEVRGTSMALNAPGMPPLTIPLAPSFTTDNVVNCRVWENHLKAVDYGEEAGQWLSTFLQEPGLRLLWSAPTMPRVDLTQRHVPWGNNALPGDQAAFTDFCSFMLTTEASLEALNSRLKEPVTMAWFRPNIVITGCPPFEEDSWQEVIIGDQAMFRMLEPCTRCQLITVHPEKGQRDPSSEPLHTLKGFRCFPKYGTSPLFGVYATVDVEGTVKVGDSVYVIRK